MSVDIQPQAQICGRLHAQIRIELRNAFDLDLAELLAHRESHMLLLGLDDSEETYIDPCRAIPSRALQAMQAGGYSSSLAGFQADVQDIFDGFEGRTDMFILNTRLFDFSDTELGPIVVHELAHYLEHIGQVASGITTADRTVADAILASLNLAASNRHTPEWALNLAVGVRHLVERHLTSGLDIGEYLNLAVPEIDRDRDIMIN